MHDVKDMSPVRLKAALGALKKVALPLHIGAISTNES